MRILTTSLTSECKLCISLDSNKQIFFLESMLGSISNFFLFWAYLGRNILASPYRVDAVSNYDNYSMLKTPKQPNWGNIKKLSSSGLRKKSMEMIEALEKEVCRWSFQKHLPEENAFNGIKRIMHLNSTHPIKEGISLIYFIRKPNVPQSIQFLDFGSKTFSQRFRWPFHCCLGFKDLYCDRDWFVDLSYYRMIDDGCDRKQTRMIAKELYLPNIPKIANAFVIPLQNLEYFINRFRNTSPVEHERSIHMKDRPHFTDIFDPRSAKSSNVETVELMMNRSIIFKYENFFNFSLPIGQKMKH